MTPLLEAEMPSPKSEKLSFDAVLEVALVIGGVPQYPFRPNPSLSPECQVNVNFQVA